MFGEGERERERLHLHFVEPIVVAQSASASLPVVPFFLLLAFLLLFSRDRERLLSFFNSF